MTSKTVQSLIQGLGYRQKSALQVAAAGEYNRNQGRHLIGLSLHQVGRGYRPFDTLIARGLIQLDEKGVMSLTRSGELAFSLLNPEVRS